MKDTPYSHYILESIDSKKVKVDFNTGRIYINRNLVDFMKDKFPTIISKNGISIALGVAKYSDRIELWLVDPNSTTYDRIEFVLSEENGYYNAICSKIVNGLQDSIKRSSDILNYDISKVLNSATFKYTKDNFLENSIAVVLNDLLVYDNTSDNNEKHIKVY